MQPAAALDPALSRTLAWALTRGTPHPYDMDARRPRRTLRARPSFAILGRIDGETRSPGGMMIVMDDLEVMARMATAQLRALFTPPRHSRHSGIELEDRPGPGRSAVWCEAHRTASGRRLIGRLCAGYGRSLEVYWQDGLLECRGLDRIEATRDDGILDVRVFTGDVVDNKGCDALLILWFTTVEFEEPLALGGRRAIDAAWAAWQDEVRAIRLAAVHELEEALPGTVRFITDEAGREDFRLTAEGRADALAAFTNPETTRDDLVDYLLEREGLTPTYPPDPGQEETAG